ncbi:carboxymuconolactone decarboxylase family protein [Cohnella hongkongensis]|uniref:Carboxymuconolactone decarboxylase family protein n=1 Tax=Cohnella hongkongensis TaxID=178337 RepID=A0ABV9FGZ5_9BACL
MTTVQRFEDGALDARTKHLIGLGAALFARHEDQVAYYAQEAKALGASDDQIRETVQVAAAAASGQVLARGLAWVQGALQQDIGASPLPEDISQASAPLPTNAYPDAEFGQDEGAPAWEEAEVSPSF